MISLDLGGHGCTLDFQHRPAHCPAVVGAGHCCKRGRKEKKHYLSQLCWAGINFAFYNLHRNPGVTQGQLRHPMGGSRHPCGRKKAGEETVQKDASKPLLQQTWFLFSLCLCLVCQGAGGISTSASFNTGFFNIVVVSLFYSYGAVYSCRNPVARLRHPI